MGWREHMKLTVVGGSGVVGSSSGYRIAQDGKVDEIVLYDVRRNLAEAHALDIEQAVVHRSTTRLRGGDADDTENSDIVFVTASVPKKDVEVSRREYLSLNLPLLLDAMTPLVQRSPSALWVIASSPVDPLVYLVRQWFSLPPARVIGLNRNDTSRFRWAVARTLSVPSTSVDCFVLGEHGETQVPAFSSIRVDGGRVTLSDHQIARIKGEMDTFFVKWNQLQPGRTAGWTSAESIGDIVHGMITGDGKAWPCSTTLNGEYGLRDVSMGVPVRLGLGKVDEIVELELEPAEKAALAVSAASIQAMIEDGKAILEEQN
jgi:malate/lactate dehydrogenase